MGANKDFSFKMVEGFDFILEEGQNTSTNLRKIAWGNSDNYKIDIRKWTYNEGGEKALKGCTLTDDGANELTNVLCDQGYGDTTKILRSLSKRDNFNKAIESYDKSENTEGYEDDGEEAYYDPKELLK